MKLTNAIEAQADERREMTITEAKQLKNILGRIVPAALLTNGWYGYHETATGKRILITRKAD